MHAIVKSYSLKPKPEWKSWGKKELWISNKKINENCYDVFKQIYKTVS